MGEASVRLSPSPDELRSKFYALRTPQDVAELVEVDLQRLYYHIYIVPKASRYTKFDIRKRSGGVRTISAPITSLKIIQRKLNQVLLQAYSPKPCVHSFLLGRSIRTNAVVHVARRNILNIDLEDFFPAINFGRVRGLFTHVPYNLNPTVATVIAQICCFDNQLPQGAPTSPIVSNMICAKMDSQMMALAKANRCDYTRYVDDITFSTNLREFPTTLATVNDLGQIEVGTELERIITGNGFKVNPDKVRLRGKSLRQQVTGITINQFPNLRRKYIRQIRAMLHAWEKFGLEAAQEEFSKRYDYDKKNRSKWKGTPSFKQVVKGKIEFLGMVRGKSDYIYLRLCGQLKALAPELVKWLISEPKAKIATPLNPLVFTEGKSDWKHMKAAIKKLKGQGQYTALNVDFKEYEYDMGDDRLLKQCAALAKTCRQLRPTIFIFDRDNLNRLGGLEKISDLPSGYKDWGNNIFSFAIPIPKHRQDNQDISIEFYYNDTEVQRTDKNGRRLFFSNEFQDTGWHKTMDVICHKLNKIRSPIISVIDSEVFDHDGKNVALSKDDFANYVLREEEGFDDFDFTEFSRIFEVIQLISESV